MSWLLIMFVVIKGFDDVITPNFRPQKHKGFSKTTIISDNHKNVKKKWLLQTLYVKVHIK